MSETKTNEILKVTATALSVYAVNLLRRAESAESQLAAVDRALPKWDGTGKGRIDTIEALLASAASAATKT